MTTILVTGFGPFPGAPFNPTAPLVEKLARLRRPSLINVAIVPHVFTTSYAAVDNDLPALIARHKPDALLMFGLATRAKSVRIEMRARNALSPLPDAAARLPGRHAIALGGPDALPMPAPVHRLLKAAHDAQVPAALSNDAGAYLCNYLCWQAADAAQQARGPRLAAFVHVPPVARFPRAKMAKHHLSLDDLVRAGERLLTATVTGLRR
jgi:pyroglutamyl-peptidase